MRRTKLCRLFVFMGLVTTLVVAALASQSASAQSIGTTLGHFQVLPRLSVLHRTGGFAGVSERLRLSGTYDLEQSPLAVYPPIVGFQNAEIWGSLVSDLPHPLVVEDVDALLNLEGLFGQQVPVGAPFDVYKFGGQTADGLSIQLHAAVIGRWMYVRGGTTPPEGGADYFEYDLRMVARSRPFADMNDDGVVDAADYTLLRDGHGGIGGGATDAVGADVTYADWREQYGDTMPDFSAIDAIIAGAGSSFAIASATPEPASVILAAVCGLALISIRKKESTQRRRS